jgi:addiction module RelE/StbE family toxin
MRVRYSPRAIEELDNIRRHISKDNPEAAWVVASFIRRAVSGLSKWPFSGRATSKENVRRLVVTNYPYVVYYRVSEEILILAVRHSAQGR